MRYGYFLSVVLAMAGTAVGCGDSGSSRDYSGGANSGLTAAQVITDCPTTRQLVCGNDGITYDNVCRAGGSENVAHDDACPDFVCNGVLCAPGFRCHGTTVFGAPVDQCVPAGDGPAVRVTATAAPTGVCNCPAGFSCRQDPSGPTSCEADPPPPPAPADRCSGFVCPAGTRCVIQLVFGAPSPACV